MNDYSFLLNPSVSNTQYLLSKNSVQADGQTLQSAGTQSELPDFRQLMTLMMLSSLSNSMGGDSGAAQGTGMDINGLIAPLMMSMLEKLIAAQVDQSESTPSIPQGMPIEGTLTQNSHTGHIALDIGAPEGTPVKSTMSGKVVYAGWNEEGYGNLVIVENGPYRTYYAHLSKIPVEVGQQVKAGEWIGQSGNTGNSTGPHLHYEVRVNGQQIDPTSLTLKAGG